MTFRDDFSYRATRAGSGLFEPLSPIPPVFRRFNQANQKPTMPTVRRTSERRRRVLYQAHVASTDASARTPQSAKLREAREPASQFGSRVNRHLRARWFSLVPVSRRAMIGVTSAVLALTAALVVAHHLAVTWPTLTVRDSIARPLRLDRPDSFAAWWLTMNLLITAGASYLIYGLRLHRRDDYRGHYQLWRLTTVVLLIACVHSVVGLVDWIGAFLDLGLGDRAVLSGGRWLRILIDVGGTILFLRLVHEIYRCRPALVAISMAALSFAVFEATAWNVFVINSIGRSTIALAAPLVGCSMLMLGSVGYLRLLFRQVRKIEDGPSLRERYEQWKIDRKHLQAPIESDFFAGASDLRPAAADVRVRRRPAESADKPDTPKDPPQSRVKDEPESNLDTQQESSSELKPETAEAPKKRRGLLDRFKRRPKAKQEPQSDTPTGDESTGDSGASPSKKVSGLFSGLKLKLPKLPSLPKRRPKVTADEDADESDADNPENPESSSRSVETRSAKRVRRRAEASPKQATEDEPDRPTPSPAAKHSSSASGDSPASGGGSAEDDEVVDPDDIDWDSLSKSERRRLRKKLRRSGRAA